jgi:hypothetical protein
VARNERKPVLRTGFRGSFALAERPEALAALAAIYLEWNRIEGMMGVMLAVFLFGPSFSTGDEILAMEIMDNWRSAQEKVSCLLKAGRHRLATHQDLLQRFEDTLVKLQGAAKQRNEVAHALWVRGDDPDKIGRMKSDHRVVPYSPKALNGILYEIECKADEMHTLFFDEIAPAVKNFLGERTAYFSSINDLKKSL